MAPEKLTMDKRAVAVFMAIPVLAGCTVGCDKNNSESPSFCQVLKEDLLLSQEDLPDVENVNPFNVYAKNINDAEKVDEDSKEGE